MTSQVLHRQLNYDLPVIRSGDGIYLYDKDGRRYVDASGGAAVSCLGHGHPKVIEAIKAQLDKMAYAHSGFFTNEAAEQLADKLCASAPDGFSRVAFLSGGTEANEAALKLARQIHLERGEHGRMHFIARHQSYHGSSLATLALAGNKMRRAPYDAIFDAGGFPSAMSQIAPCYPYRNRQDGEDEQAYGRRAAAELETEILRIGPEKVAAFVAETVVGATLGVVPPASGYFQEVRRICDKYGVFLILDEVMCGIGRTGTLFAFEQEGIVPDMVTIAKGLGAGYQPIGAVMLRAGLAEHIEAGSGLLKQGHTYMAHATSCAGALAVQNVIESEDLLANVRARGDQFRTELQDRLGQHPHVGDVRGRGLFLGLEFVADRANKTPFPRKAAIADTLKRQAMANGLICYPGNGTSDGIDGDHVLLAPPFITTSAQITEISELVEASVKHCLANVNS